ncbi:MAG: PQQ-binding-like beta-propeller repeat protein [bacterium]|nr:PQQ-binding-like beta-propeller repeat protein [bacterium]
MCRASSRWPVLFLTLPAALVTGASVSGTRAATPSAPWPQWGGVNGDFKTPATGLADSWPAGGPDKLWSRPLGEGFSAIVADGEKLYTMYRQGDDEIVVALKADSGKTAWEHRYRARPHDGQTEAYGQGPNATPLLLSDRVITIGFTGLMHCLDVRTGKPVWSHDLVNEFGGTAHYYGYANSPIEYNGTIITLVGGQRYGIVALKPADGTVAWKSKPYDVSYAAPILINVDGQDQLVFFSTNEVIGLDPKNGAHLWSHLVVNFCRTNCTSAVWGPDNLLWAATKGVGGTRVLKLTQSDGRTQVEEVWMNRKIRVYHWNAVRIGDRIYTSVGDAQKFLSVIDVKTGKQLERQRGFGSTNSIYADGKLILLDEDGRLALAKALPDGIKVLSSVDLAGESVFWTPPTLVGRTLYVRDRSRIMALDLG